MGGHTAEQIVAGVVLSERLAVTMYGAIHRAQFNGARNLRALVIDAKMLADTTFRRAIAEDRIGAAIALAHDSIVPAICVESDGQNVVVVTRGVGRYVTVQDLISAARANRKEGGKLPLAVAAAIARSVVEALAIAHDDGVVHGAVHPRSVLVDEDGAIRLGDFVVGRALTTAVSQGADSSLWRGLAGYLAPELVVGEEPTQSSDVFACGALLFTMLSGEVPPGTLNVTPAVERLVQRALDGDISRRYRNASDLLENMVEAFEDDRWAIADRGEIIRAAGLSSSDTNIDEATEDLLASLGNSAVQVTPMRPSMESRAEAVAARHHQKTPTGANRLDALLADLDGVAAEHTRVEEMPNRRDPISELIQHDPRKKEAIVQVRARVPSLDDPDDETPLPGPAPSRDSDDDVPRPNDRDEYAAMNALRGLDRPVHRMSSAAEQAEQAAAKLEQAAARAQAAAEVVTKSAPQAIVAPQRSVPLIDVPELNVPTPRVRSRTGQVIGIISLLAIVGAGIFIYKRVADAADETERNERENADKAAKDKAEREELERKLREGLADPGAVEITSNPTAGVWLRLGTTPVESLRLEANTSHEIALVLDGYQLGEIQVLAKDWTGEGAGRRAEVHADLAKLEPPPSDKKDDKKDDKKKDAKPDKSRQGELPVQPTERHLQTGAKGAGRIKIITSPSEAEAFLFVGITSSMHFGSLTAGRDYTFYVVKPGWKTKKVEIKAEDWRDDPDLNKPIDSAKKKSLLNRSVDLEELPKKPGGK